MAKVEILSSNSNVPVEMVEREEAIAPTTTTDPAPTTFSFPLEGEPGEAVFNAPKIKHLRQADRLIQEQLKEKKGKASKVSQVDIFRKIAELCLVSWGDRSSMPDDSEIDLLDDDLMIEKILRHFIEDFDEELGEEELVNIAFARAEKDAEPTFRILPDRNMEIDLSVGKIVIRRLTKKDSRFVETSDNGSVSNSIHLAVGACIDWWGRNSKNRDLMPADLDPLPIGDFWRLREALSSFRKQRSHSR